MATRLKNILRHPIIKTILYLVFGGIVFSFSFYTMNNMLSDKDGKYFKNFTYDSIFVDDFYKSSYVDGILSIAFVNLNEMAVELSNPEYEGEFEKDKINYIPRNYQFKKVQQLFANDKKFSYYFETTGGFQFASEDLQGLSKEEIKNSIYENSLYAWIDYRVDEMGLDFDSSSKITKAKLSNNHYYESIGNLDNIRVLYVSYSDKILNLAKEEWNFAHDHYAEIKKNLFISTVILAFIFVLLSLGAGRKGNSEKKIELFFDPVFIEIKLFIIGFVLKEFSTIIINNLYEPSNLPYEAFFISTLLTLLSYICLMIAMSVLRNLKSEDYRKRFFIYKMSIWIVNLFKFFIDFFKAIFNIKKIDAQSSNTKIHRYVNSYVLISACLMIFAFFFQVVFAYSLMLIAFITELVLSTVFVLRIKKLIDLSNNEIKDRVKEASKSEKMKTELITNVSHDLKTPLTSIIGYIDLLKKEDLNDSAMDYVKILEQKSNKLKDIIEDLFVLSKSESGSMDIDIEVLDLKKLIEQSLANMDDKIRESGFQIVSDLPDQDVLIKSDGKKLYRIMQNLIDNALKYSLKGTRIFISLGLSIDNRAELKIKNTSSYEMNFSKEEIIERFARGDKSRTQDGSGLGLAIVESFTGLLGGNFDITIDGDLFIVDLNFKIVEA